MYIDDKVYTDILKDLAETKKQYAKLIRKVDLLNTAEGLKKDYPEAVENILQAAFLYKRGISVIGCNSLSLLTDQSSSNIEDELDNLVELLGDNPKRFNIAT